MNEAQNVRSQVSGYSEDRCLRLDRPRAGSEFGISDFPSGSYRVVRRGLSSDGFELCVRVVDVRGYDPAHDLLGVLAWAEALGINAPHRPAQRLSALPGAALAQPAGDAAGGADLDRLRAAVYQRLGEQGYAVIECETGGFRLDVIYGPTRGAEGEIGLAQLHEQGKLPAFYAAGYTDPWSPWQQLDFLEDALPDDPGAWRNCLP